MRLMPEFRHPRTPHQRTAAAHSFSPNATEPKPLAEVETAFALERRPAGWPAL